MPHSERGYRFEVECIQDTIAGRTARGENYDFEKNLLKAWGKYFKDAHRDALAAMCEVKI